MTKAEQCAEGGHVNSNDLLGVTPADAPMFDFDLIYIARHNDSYYVARWDLAKPMRIRAETTRAAFEIATKVLGDAPRDRHWLFEVKKITDSRITDSLKVPPNAEAQLPERSGGQLQRPVGRQLEE